MKTWNRDWLGIAVVVVALGTAVVMALAVTQLVRSPPPAAPSLDGPIDFRIGGGFSGGGHGCPVHIELDGSATRDVRGIAKVPFRVEPGALDELRRSIEAADLASLEPPRASDPDDFYDTVSVQLGGKVYTISVGERGPLPPRLDAVMRPLRRLADDSIDCTAPRSPELDGPIDYRAESAHGAISAHIELDGVVTPGTERMGNQRFRLERDELAALLRQLHAADLAKLERSYESGGNGGVSEVISARLGGVVYTVRVGSAAAIPMRLTRLLKLLRAAAQLPRRPGVPL